MLTHLMHVAQKLQTQPVILFPEEEEMFQKVNEVFEDKKEVQEASKNLKFELFKEEDLQDVLGFEQKDTQQMEEEKESFFGSFFEDSWNKIGSIFGDFEKPVKSYHTYKPSYYHYYDDPKQDQQQKYKDDPQAYSKYYNDKYGKRIRRIKIDDFNSKLNNHGDLASQYWYNRTDSDNYNFDTDIFNSLINDKDEDVYLEDDENNPEDIQKLFVTGLTNMLQKKKQKEEDDDAGDDYDPNTPQGDIFNKVVDTYDIYNIKNQIDDLQELLENSTAYQEALDNLNGEQYIDNKFEANEYSIYGFGDRKDYSLEDLQQLPWIRPEEFFHDEEIKLYDTIHCNDIEQGGLGDCYFLAAISSIAEYPERLERLFLTKEYNPEGIYVLAMCISGIWQEVILDDLVPCTKYSKNPAFNRSKSHELWVILLEKAWAKIHGGYMNIAAGLTREALRDLTGASAITYFTSQNREELWERLVQANLDKHIMTAGSDNLNNGSDAYIEKIGIAGSHAYSLLEVFELDKDQDYKILTPDESKDDMNIERLVKLRNPWGKGEWKGDWGDDSWLWTPYLREELGYSNEDDGVFFMTWNDFLKYYSDLQICYYHDNYKYSALQVQSEKNAKVILKFTLELEGKYYFSLNQKNKRMYPRSKRYQYSHCAFVAARVKEDGEYDFVGANIRADKENWVGDEMKAGDYYILIKTPWRSFVNEFSFSVYGPDKTDIEVVDEHEVPKDFIKKILISHSKEDTETSQRDFTSQGHENIFYKTFDNKGGFGYIYFENNSEEVTLDATVELLGSVNIKVCSPFNGLRPSVVVKPGCCELIPYEAECLPYSAQMRMMAAFKKGELTDGLREKVKQSPTVLTKSYQGSAVDIKVYVLYHSNGLALLYENNTEEYTIAEELEFNLENCHIDGAYGSYIELTIEPGKDRLLKIVKDEGVDDFSARIKKLYYKVF